jgi:hypothetical protein
MSRLWRDCLTNLVGDNKVGTEHCSVLIKNVRNKPGRYTIETYVKTAGVSTHRVWSRSRCSGRPSRS